MMGVFSLLDICEEANAVKCGASRRAWPLLLALGFFEGVGRKALGGQLP